jgi:hypothetical protein
MPIVIYVTATERGRRGLRGVGVTWRVSACDVGDVATCDVSDVAACDVCDVATCDVGGVVTCDVGDVGDVRSV